MFDFVFHALLESRMAASFVHLHLHTQFSLLDGANQIEPLVQQIKEQNFRYSTGRLTIHLAREFGFCYGVDRAVDYAYQARKRFPDRQVYLTGEIIHNPHVNDQLRAQGIRFLSDAGESLDSITPDHVVILPAFGTTVELLKDLSDRGCTLGDTTCGSVLNVWKNVRRYAEDGFTSVIHGKYWHEETRATASQARRTGQGHYLVVLDRAEATLACEYIRGHGSRDAFLRRFEPARRRGVPVDVLVEIAVEFDDLRRAFADAHEIGDVRDLAVGAPVKVEGDLQPAIVGGARVPIGNLVKRIGVALGDQCLQLSQFFLGCGLVRWGGRAQLAGGFQHPGLPLARPRLDL